MIQNVLFETPLDHFVYPPQNCTVPHPPVHSLFDFPSTRHSGLRFGWASLRTWRLLLILTLHYISAELLVNWFSPLLGPFIESIVDADQLRFYTVSLEALAVVMAIALVTGLFAWLGELTALEWRTRIVAYSCDLYFAGGGAHLVSRVSAPRALQQQQFQALDSLDHSHRNNGTLEDKAGSKRLRKLLSGSAEQHPIDNADSRIAGSSRELANLAVGVILGNYSFTAPVAGQLLTMGVALRAILESSGWLPAVALLIFIAAACLTVPPLMQRVAMLTFSQDHVESDLRYRHALVRTFAEAIGFMSSPEMSAETRGNGRDRRNRMHPQTGGW